ncbi:MAG: hypothetical protein E7172_03450 [Firmicutes bacterium]|nr:hypothetical protein [Bacillota bacterium]
MYLKSIRAQGFKSFADKIDLEINPGITGIVGPNGSGKSNIVDAVRWVLGEQSVKSLRGSNSMSDVIFNGSVSRDAQKRAMVALIFDNSDNYLKSEFKEIEIKRVVYKSGENEYFLNNNKVRLKDITDLFLESNAGSGAFNIISQGNVTDIVNSKSSDRRLIFESSAGVLKYKKRKEESLKKLEKTEENLVRIKLIIDEVKKSVEPLEKQSIIAQKYIDFSSELKNIDIALICEEISSINTEYQNLVTQKELLNNKLLTLNNFEEETTLEKLKLDSISLEEKINLEKEKLLSYTKMLSELNSEKQLTLERQKYDIDKKNIDENLLKLKEEVLALENIIEITEKEVKEIDNNILDEKKSLEEINNKLIVFKVKRSNINNTIMEKNKQLFMIQNKINIFENNILNDSLAPTSVRNVLNNPRLRGIHNTIGKLIDVDNKYVLALDTVLGYNKNFLVVDSENDAMEAIEFLKSKNMGRATFFPLNIIKPRFIDQEILNNIKNIEGFLGVFSKIVHYDKIYENIIENQLGNVLVVKNSKTLNTIGKLIDYKYRIVSLDGEILHVGGSITGGSSKQNNLINEKNELEKLKNDNRILIMEIELLNNELEEMQKNLEDYEEKDKVINKYLNLLGDELFNKKSNLSRIIENYREKKSELKGIEDLLDDKLNEKLVVLLEEIASISKEKELLEKQITKLSKEFSDLKDEINELEHIYKEKNSNYSTIQNELKNKEILMGKYEVRLDNLLGSLNEEYNLTYDKASINYTLEMDYEVAKEKVDFLKKEISKLGEVNIGSISEYERLKTRYDFLDNQKKDLENSSQELKEIILQLDEIMIEKFATTFELIKSEFQKMFKIMFKGGKGDLVLTDPNDLLNTGIDIIAIPPGKKINNTMSLSGGEKALTAIVLLFAMLEVKPSPFVILDEAEAALDEVNVDMFGKYLNEEKKHSQFIVITHKKRMMEYADCLYGITMQESGVSKIVSAKLENLA